MLNRSDLHTYQTSAVDYIIGHDSCALFLQMGLGKSVITLTAIADLIDNVEIQTALVVAPKKVAESTWAQEAAGWEHLRHLRVSRVLGSPAQRALALSTEADVYVTSRDLVADVLAKATANGKRFDMLVLDELTSFKNSKALRFRAVRKARPLFRRCVGLTGTPTPNGLLDLWAQMYCVDMGKSLGIRKGDYTAAYFRRINCGQFDKYEPLPRAREQILRRLEGVSLTMKAADYLTLPPYMESTVRVELSETQLARYKTFERESVLQYTADTEGKDGAIIATAAAALCNKLCQYAHGAVYNADGLAVEFHQEKLDALMEILESAVAGGESVLVFCQYRHDYTRIMSRRECRTWRVRKYEGDDDLTAWNAGQVDVLLTHPASTAYGLNLQRGGHVVVWFGTGWNSEYYAQGNARLYRQGQTQPVRVLRLVVRGTMDERALAAVTGKITAQDAMLEALKEKVRQYSND